MKNNKKKLACMECEKDSFIREYLDRFRCKLEKYLPEKGSVMELLEKSRGILMMDIDHIQREIERVKQEVNK